LEYYKAKFFDGEKNSETAFNKDAIKAVLNPMFQNGVLNFQRPAFYKYFQSATNRDGQMDSDTREMWKHLKRKVDDYGQDLTALKYAKDEKSQEVYNEKFKMLFKKFCVYFKEDYVEEDQQKIIQYFKE
jgi:hypothetical protein